MNKNEEKRKDLKESDRRCREPVTCRGRPLTSRMATSKEGDNGVKERKRGVVEKLHPAHCIENLDEEEATEEKKE